MILTDGLTDLLLFWQSRDAITSKNTSKKLCKSYCCLYDQSYWHFTILKLECWISNCIRYSSNMSRCNLCYHFHAPSPETESLDDHAGGTSHPSPTEETDCQKNLPTINFPPPWCLIQCWQRNFWEWKKCKRCTKNGKFWFTKKTKLEILVISSDNTNQMVKFLVNSRIDDLLGGLFIRCQ